MSPGTGRFDSVDVACFTDMPRPAVATTAESLSAKRWSTVSAGNFKRHGVDLSTAREQSSLVDA